MESEGKPRRECPRSSKGVGDVEVKALAGEGAPGWEECPSWWLGPLDGKGVLEEEKSQLEMFEELALCTL